MKPFQKWLADTKIKINIRNFVLEPDGIIKLLWDVFCMLLIFYEIIAIPLEISFSLTISESWEILVDTCFFFDIILNFNTGFYYNGIVEKDHELIFWNYLQMWFWIDLGASFPYNRVVEYQMS